ncbi:hypothetical protein NEPAR08_2557, partial [Nematocida parisii]
ESKYYIDLKDSLIGKSHAKSSESHYREIQNLLEKIGGIRCMGMMFNYYIDIPCKLVKMLVNQIIFEDSLRACSVCFQKTLPDASSSIDEMDCEFELPEKLEKTWKACTPIALSIRKCSQGITEYFLKSVKSREIKRLLIKDMEPGMELLNLGEKEITEECPITLDTLSDTKRVILPRARNNTYAYIKILGVPMLQEIVTKDISSSAIVSSERSLCGRAHLHQHGNRIYGESKERWCAS